MGRGRDRARSRSFDGAQHANLAPDGEPWRVAHEECARYARARIWRRCRRAMHHPPGHSRHTPAQTRHKACMSVQARRPRARATRRRPRPPSFPAAFTEPIARPSRARWLSTLGPRAESRHAQRRAPAQRRRPPRTIRLRHPPMGACRGRSGRLPRLSGTRSRSRTALLSPVRGCRRCGRTRGWRCSAGSRCSRLRTRPRHRSTGP